MSPAANWSAHSPQASGVDTPTGLRLDDLLAPGERPLPLIVMVVEAQTPGAAEHVARLLRHTPNGRVVLIDDATTEGVMATVNDDIELIRHHRPQGHRRCAAQLADGVGPGGLVLVDGACEVGPGWLAGLLRVAHGLPDVAAVSALRCDPTDVAPLTWSEVARAGARGPGGVAAPVEDLTPGCVLLTAAGLRTWRAAAPDADRLDLIDLATAARAAGQRVITANRVLVRGRRRAGVAAPAPVEPGAPGSIPLRRLYVTQGQPDLPADQPLHDCARALSYLQESLLLTFTPDGFEIGLLEALVPTPWLSWTGPDLPAALATALLNLGIDLVHVENSAPGPLALLLEVAERIGVPRVLSRTRVDVAPLPAERVIVPSEFAAVDLPAETTVLVEPGLRMPGLRPIRRSTLREPGPLRVLAWSEPGQDVGDVARWLGDKLGPWIEPHVLAPTAADLGDLPIAHGQTARSPMIRVLRTVDPDVGLIVATPGMAWTAAAEVFWALGVPVLVIGDGESAARVRARGGGLIVPADDVEAAAERLGRLARHPAELNELRASVPITSVFPRSAAAERYRACYDDLEYRRGTRPRLGYLLWGELNRQDGCGNIRVLARLAAIAPEFVAARQVFLPELLHGDALDGLDVLLVQKRYLGSDADPLLARLRATGVRMVMDLDDDLLDEGAAHRSMMDPRTHDYLRREIRARLHAADTLLLSTDDLVERVGELSAHPPVLVPNHLNPRLWTAYVPPLPAPAAPGFRILYMGTKTHLEDLQLLELVLGPVSDALGVPVTLEVVGIADAFDGDGWITRLNVPRGVQHYPEFVRWLRERRGRWHLAVAPLVDSYFNRAKSDLKLLEYAMLDLPVVASDAGPYRGHEHLARLTDNDPASWIASLVEVLGNTELATARAVAAREHVAAHRMITEQNGRNWLSVLLGAADPTATTTGATGPEAVRYADGAEDQVLATLRASDDVRAGCDELARRAHVSWEMEYHFSPQRLGLLAPLRLDADLRVADLGCGSGVLARAIGETGASVLGVEGVPARAAAAAVRCADLLNVEIVQGRAEQVVATQRDLDMVVVCGLLEYTAGDADGPAKLLRAVSEALAPDGVLVLAIENQLGLGYLAGRHEDHHNTPWVGLADYPLLHRSPRTWTTRRLGAMLADHGLAATRWLVPYPDYKLPRVVLDADVFDLPDAADLVDKFVRHPLDGAFRGSEAVVPGRRFQRVLIEEGLGLSTAPCFLVVCARTPEAIAKHTRDDLGWLVNNHRITPFRRTRVLTRDMRLDNIEGTEFHTVDWLQHRVDKEVAVVPGRPMDSLLLDALHAGDEPELHRLLQRWHNAAATGAATAAFDEAPPHPFRPGTAGPVWRPDRLDSHPGNWIAQPNGTLSQIDDEWLAAGGVDAELASMRALFQFAREVVVTRSAHPWGATATVQDVFGHLCAPLGLADAARDRLEELFHAEAALQHLVTGAAEAALVEEQRAQLGLTEQNRWWDVPGGLETTTTGLAQARSQIDSLRGAVSYERRTNRRVERRLSKAEASLVASRAESDQLRQRLARARSRLHALEASPPVRTIVSVQRQVGRARRIARRVIRELSR